jgi:Na+-transporting methylmalonyl-CoA/oxaloacetate decarboxylase gamma subunit
MALVFLTLTLIIVALILLTRLPGLKPRPQTKEQAVTENTSTDASAPLAPDTHAAQETELAQVAAIAVALLQSRKTRQPRPRPVTETSRWKQYGRAHQLGL